MSDLISILEKSQLLAAFPQEYKEQLAQSLRRVEFKKGETVFNEGDPGDAVYFIETGGVGVYLSDKALGIDLEIARLKEGEVFGEMALLTDEPRSATCRATDQSVIYSLSSHVFTKLLQSVAQPAAALCKILAKRVAVLDRSHGLQAQSLAKYSFDPQVYGMLPEKILHQHKLIPLAFAEGTMTVATTKPQNAVGFDAIRRVIRGVRLDPILISEEDYEKFVKHAHAHHAAKESAREQRLPGVHYFADVQDKGDKAGAQVPSEDVVGLVSSILAEAVVLDASDIHIEPDREGTVVRFRVDGRLRRREGRVVRQLHRPVVSRLKVLASLDISETRVSQDGRFSIEVDGREIDCRLSVMATRNGEKAVIRLLDPGSALVDLSRVILADKVLQVVRKIIMQPHGAVLITGPTGSGKTTTMYAMLMERKSPEINIVTVEDPIEYAIPGITQTQVNQAIGVGFPDALRTFVRQDPDIILVGEVRDTVTAKMALEAGLTGKLVLSSFHTNDSIGALVRLAEMGCEPFTMGNVIRGIMCQRLLRRLCPACAQLHQYPEPVIKSLIHAKVFTPYTVPDEMYQPKGCPACNNTGFKGRVAALEVLTVNDEIRKLIALSAPPAEIAAAGENGALVTLARYCSFLLINKLTVPSEVLRVLPREEDLSWGRHSAVQGFEHQL
jgi:type IV pilus assembly protein PilB